jgi:cyclophilin family peptidyl-prolyl cis-trans isomerase
MANCGEKNTNGSQFYITLNVLHWLNEKHVVFGEVVDGFDVIDDMEKYGTESGIVSHMIEIDDCG